MSATFQIEGLADLEAAMLDMSRAISKRIAVNALTTAAEPLVDRASELAPVLSGHLETHIAVGTKLSRRQTAAHVKVSPVEIFVGPDNAPQGLQQEFGNKDMAPQPFMRPAWDETKHDVMLNVADDLKSEVGKAAERAARRAAKRIAEVAR